VDYQVLIAIVGNQSHAQQAVSHPERVSLHLSCRHDGGSLIMGIFLPVGSIIKGLYLAAALPLPPTEIS
jgi:hypothetical protein